MRDKKETLNKEIQKLKLKKTAKKQKLQERGITLIALVVTIIILLILAGVTLNIALSDNGLFKKAKEAVDKYDTAQKDEESQLETLEGMLGDLSNEEKDEEGKIKVNKPKLAEGMIPIKYDKTKSKWVITNEKDKEWYDYSEGTMLWANVMLSDGKYKTSEKEDNSKNGHYSDDGTTEVEDGELGSMFVWIPRYAYSFNSYHTEMDGEEGTTQNITKVAFLSETSDRGYNGDVYPKTYDPVTAKEGDPTPMVVHPGFTFGGEQLTGIWVGKFEASMSGENKNTRDDNNIETSNKASDTHSVKILPNADTWRYISLGNIFFNCLRMNGDSNIYGLNNENVDTHLMKNIEWGVCSYLAASQYGSTPTMNNSGEREGTTGDVYHEYTGGKNYITNASQSTTGNVTGIYDMCGGTWERVAAYYDNLDQSLKDYGLNAFAETTGKGIELVETYAKYWDKYEVGEEEKKVEELEDTWRNKDIWNEDGSQDANQKRIDITKERYEKMSKKSNGTSRIGDGLYEIIKDYSYYGVYEDNKTRNWMKIDKKADTTTSWGLGYYNKDFTGIGNCAQTFMMRGGVWSDGTKAGIFASTGDSGNPYNHPGFRPVLVI